MRERIDTIPLNEAFSSGDECPFCYLQRQAEQRAIRYAIGPGASYMEPEVRGTTDREGFCREHLKKLHDYGNALGCALILQTYYVCMIQELEAQLDSYEVPKKGLFTRKTASAGNPVIESLKRREQSCFLCNSVNETMERYFGTFFVMIKDQEFRTLAESSKGFCMVHFRQLLEEAERNLPNSQREWFVRTLIPLTVENLCRVKEDIDLFVAKNDFRNAHLEWKNARDAVSRGMQKLKGGHPADPVYRNSDFGTGR